MRSILKYIYIPGKRNGMFNCPRGGKWHLLKEVNMYSMLKTQSGWQKVTEQETR